MDFQAQLVENLRSQLAQINKADAELVVALSGGADSVALLVALAQSEFSNRLRAVHVNHGLNESAAGWQRFCQDLCRSLAIPLSCKAVEVSEAQKKQLGLEAAARNVRYSAMSSELSGKAALLTAHHADDQLETILYRLERGTELAGLAGMKAYLLAEETAWGVAHCRPMLTLRKAAAISYLESQQQAWVEDPSNHDASIKRSFYRTAIVPQLCDAQMEAVLELSKKAVDCVSALARREVSISSDAFEFGPLRAETEALQSYYLKRWFQAKGIGLPKARFKELIRQLRLGSGRGQQPFYQSDSYSLWVKGRVVAIEKFSRL